MKIMLNLKSKTKLILVVAILILIAIFILSIYFSWPFGKNQSVDEISSNEFESGTIGEIEIKEGETKESILEKINPEAIRKPVRPLDTAMPSTVFDTKAEILSIASDRITVKGSGENFEDQIQRTLIVKYIDFTKTFINSKELSFDGLEGLKYLNIGEKILISSSENIRGKTEFSASYINKI